MSEFKALSVNNLQKMAILVYLGKMNKQYTSRHLSILQERRILDKNQKPTYVGDIILKNHNGGEVYARKVLKRGNRAT